MSMDAAVLSAWERGAEQSPGQRGRALTFLWDWGFSPSQLREIASHLVQLQEALNELSEEHNAAMTQSQEKQGQLEGDLRAALQEKVRGPWGPAGAVGASVELKPGDCASPRTVLSPTSLSPEMLRREDRDSPGEDFSAGGPAGQAGGLQRPGEGRGHGGCPEGTAGSRESLWLPQRGQAALRWKTSLAGENGGCWGVHGKAVWGRAGCALLLEGSYGAEHPFVPNSGMPLPGSCWLPSLPSCGLVVEGAAPAW